MFHKRQGQTSLVEHTKLGRCTPYNLASRVSYNRAQVGPLKYKKPQPLSHKSP